MVYEYIPQKNLKKISGMLTVLISAAVGFFLFPTLFPTLPLRWIFQLSGVVCLVAVIFIASRYIGKSIIYAVIDNGEGGLDLTVTEVTNGGRSRITVCRFSIDNIEDAVRTGGDGQLKKKLGDRAKKEHRKTFNYCVEFNDPNACYIFVTECGELLLIKLSPDATLWGYLTNKA